MRIRRCLYLVHRWLGVSLCLLIAMWFFSGVVMMYVGFPYLTEGERLASLPVLEAQSVRVAPAALLEQVEGSAGIDQLRLSSVLGRPAYMLRTGDGTRHWLFADTGEMFGYFGTEDALRAARLYAANLDIDTHADITYLTQLEMDQWSTSSAFQRHRPLHLVALNDAGGTQLYVSSQTGEVLRDTAAYERAWNWLGANLHWLYPMQLRRHATVWHWVVVVLSLAGLVSIISGAIVGVIRLRLRKPYRGKNVTPYRGNMKLHHILGLCFLLPLTTYMFSGLMSMNPWGIFTDEIPYSDQHSAYRSSPTTAKTLTRQQSVDALREALDNHQDAREVVWQWLGGTAYQYTVAGDNQRELLTQLAVPGSGENNSRWEKPGVAQLREIMAGFDISAIEQLDAYDSYYYSHHENWRPLPVLRVRFNDPAQTWFHLDLGTGEMLNRLTATGRVQRWLYNGLHSLDFLFLIYNRPLWDVIVIALCIAGFVFSVTSVVIGWRRLRPKSSRRRRHKNNQQRMATL